MATSDASTLVALSREFRKDGEFGDPDITPKPLQIAKRGSLRLSGPIALDITHPFGSPQLQHSLAPTRTSSISKDVTQLNRSLLDNESPKNDWHPSSTMLYVHKQRRRSSSYTGSLVPSAEHSDVSPSAPVSRHARPGSHALKSGLGGTQEQPKRVTAAGCRPVRAFSTGVFENINSFSPIKGEELDCSDILITHTGRRRAVTTNDTPSRVSEPGKSVQYNALHRHPSFKKRLLTRMMGGLAPRWHDSHSGVKGKRQSLQLLPENAQSFNSRPHQKTDLGRRSISSETETCTGGELNSTLSSFPTPPTTSYTSPTSAASSRSSRLPSQRYLNLCKPVHNTVMGAELTLTSEYDAFDSTNGMTTLVAIDVQGALTKTIYGQDRSSQHNGLDVVVVIDNSFYTSPSTLMDSCETARFLASMLNVVTDRMAIICTSSLQEFDSTLIWPLSQVKTQKIKLSLDGITTTRQIPSAYLWEQAIAFARGILVHTPIQNENSRPLQDAFGHVFVLTGNALGLSSEILADDRLQFHLVCPANVPRESFHSIKCNGWKLQSQCDNELRAVSAKKDTNPTSLLNRLREVIVHARDGRFEGVLTDIILDVKPRQYCSIESSMGRKELSLLHPGESFTVLVKVRVHGAQAKGYSLPHALTRSSIPMNANDILSDLDEMLGPPTIKLLTARLKYKHSVLPTGTVCSISADCSVKRQIRTPSRANSQPQPRVSQPKDCSKLIQKRLAYFTATQGSPRHALSNLRGEFGDAGTRSSCPDYIRLIMKELEFQIRILDRLELDASLKKPLKASNSIFEESLAGHSAKGPVQPDQYGARDWMTDAVDGRVMRGENDKPAMVSGPGKDTRTVEKAGGEVDEAGALWCDGRRETERPQLRQMDINLRGGDGS